MSEEVPPTTQTTERQHDTHMDVVIDPAKLWKYHLTKESRKAFQTLCYVLNVAAYGDDDKDDDVIAPHFVMYDILEDIPEYLRTEHWSFKWAREYVEKGVTLNPEKYNEHILCTQPHVPRSSNTYVTDVSIPCMNVSDEFCIVCLRLHGLNKQYIHDLGLCTGWEKPTDCVLSNDIPKFSRNGKNTFNFVCMCRKHNNAILLDENGKMETQPLPKLENDEPGPVHIVASLYGLDPEAMWEFVHVEGQTEITAFHDESDCFANPMASSYVQTITKEHKPQLFTSDACRVSGGDSRNDCPTRVDIKNVRGRGGSRKCFNCGLAGHVKRNCPELRKDHHSDGKCFKCGLPGHWARDCPN